MKRFEWEDGIVDVIDDDHVELYCKAFDIGIMDKEDADDRHSNLDKTLPYDEYNYYCNDKLKDVEEIE